MADEKSLSSSFRRLHRACNGLGMEPLRPHGSIFLDSLWKINLSIGATGEYSDKRDWYVAATLSKDLAETILSKCQNEYQKALVQCNNDISEFSYQFSRKYLVDNRDPKKDFGLISDPYFQVDNSGTSYYLITIPLIQGESNG